LTQAPFIDAEALVRDALLRLRADPTGATLTDEQKLAYVRSAIAEGLADAEAGRVSEADIQDIKRRARLRYERARR
jgi:predicted transcriptional regulator